MATTWTRKKNEKGFYEWTWKTVPETEAKKALGTTVVAEVTGYKGTSDKPKAEKPKAKSDSKPKKRLRRKKK